jgi:kinesin family protein 11
VTVFAYGATGAGKTHTMMGNTRHDDASSNADAGIIPNALQDVFAYIAKERQKLEIGEKWNVGVTFIEVYNEQV